MVVVVAHGHGLDPIEQDHKIRGLLGQGTGNQLVFPGDALLQHGQRGSCHFL